MAQLYHGELPFWEDEQPWRVHDFGTTCWCHPKIEVDDKYDVIIVHRTISEIKALRMDN